MHQSETAYPQRKWLGRFVVRYKILQLRVSVRRQSWTSWRTNSARRKKHKNRTATGDVSFSFAALVEIHFQNASYLHHAHTHHATSKKSFSCLTSSLLKSGKI
jgi:hypothetical protein